MSAELVPLGDVIRHRKVFITIDDATEYKRCRVQTQARGVVLRDRVKGAEVKTKKQQVCRPGDFIVAEIDAKVGGYGFISEDLDGAIVSSHYYLFEVDESKLRPEYLAAFIQTPKFAGQIRAEGSTNYAAIRPRDVLAIRMPLPSLAEQHRIAAITWEADALLARLTATLDAADADLAAFRRRLLQDAVEGRLSAHDADIEDVSLRSILREKSRNGYSGRPSDSEPGIPLLRISAGTSRADFRVEESDHKYAPVALAAVSDLVLEPGDLLACRFNGSLHLVGRFSLFEGKAEAPRIFPDKLIRFRIDSTKADPEFVLLAMNSPAGRAQVEALCSTTAGNIGLSANRLNDVALPLPPLAEQRRIVARVDALTAAGEAVAGRLALARDDARALRARLLREAFAA